MLTVPVSSRTKKELVQQIHDQYAADGNPISPSRAGRIADKILRGTFGPNPDLARVIRYADPTGEKAVRNVLRQQKGGPGAHSAKNRTETANTPR